MNARETAGLSQAELADKLGVLQRTVSYWEHGTCTVRPDQIGQIAAVLKVSGESLLSDAPSPPKAKPGPPSKLQQKLELIQKLPHSKQQAILQVLDMALASHA